MITSEEFFANYKHALKHDFEVDGQPAPFLPNHPRRWGTEDARIELPSMSTAKRIALSDDGSLLAVAADNQVFVYGTSTMALQLAIGVGHVEGIGAMQFRPGNNRILAVGSSLRKGNRMEHLVRLWDLDEEQGRPGGGPLDIIAAAAAEGTQAISRILMERLDWTEEDIRSLNIEHDIQGILQAAQVQLDIRHGKAFSGTIGNFESKAFSHDGSVMLYHPQDGSSNAVVVLDVETLQERFRLVGHTDRIMWSETSPDDTLIGTSSWDRTVRIWDASSGDLIRTLTGASNQSWGAAFSPDNKLIAAGSGDRVARIWSVETGELLHALEGSSGWIRSFAFSPDGKALAAGSAGGMLRTFDVASGDCTQRWEIEAGGSFVEVRNVQYTSKGVLVFKNDDGCTFLFDAEAGRKGQFEHGPDVIGKPAALRNAVVSPDGNTLYTADFDGVVRVWRLG